MWSNAVKSIYCSQFLIPLVPPGFPNILLPKTHLLIEKESNHLLSTLSDLQWAAHKLASSQQVHSVFPLSSTSSIESFGEDSYSWILGYGSSHSASLHTEVLPMRALFSTRLIITSYVHLESCGWIRCLRFFTTFREDDTEAVVNYY